MKTKSKLRASLPLVLALGLALAVGLQWFGGRADPGYRPPLPLKTLVPQKIAGGWEVVDQPLAASREEQAMIAETLNYNDALFRVYRRGSEMFTVYAAHWDPGRMSPRLIASHTPDTCWLGHGWERQADAERQPQGDGVSEAAAVSQLLAKGSLLPAQFRIFRRKEGAAQHLVFWHINGREVVNYESQAAPPWWSPVPDLLRYGLNQRREQWFVRIGSTVPYPELWRDAGFQQVLAALGQMALGPTPAASTR